MRIKKTRTTLVLARWMTIPMLLAAPGARAEEDKPLSPYIDQLKREIEASKAQDAPKDKAGSGSEGYTQRIQDRLKARPDPDAGVSYTEDLRRQLKEAETPPDSYTGKIQQELEAERAKDPDAERNASAIQAVREGRSELHAKMKSEIHHAAGIRYGASLSRIISAGTQLRDFDSIYGQNYAPDVSLFYEYQPFHSEWFGNIGLMANLGVGYFHGTGVFQFQLAKPPQMGGGSFASDSRTQFQFLTLPLVVGINYRFNLLRILRPFVAAGPALVGYLELRNDDGDTRYGESRGLFLAGGVSILLDWISRGSSWDLYAEHGIKHYYITVDYSRLSTFSGDLSATMSGVNAGFTFEF